MSGSAGTSAETSKLRVWDGPADTETAVLIATTAVAVVAQNAEVAHGVAWVSAATARSDRWDAICWSQLADVPRWI